MLRAFRSVPMFTTYRPIKRLQVGDCRQAALRKTANLPPFPPLAISAKGDVKWECQNMIRALPDVRPWNAGRKVVPKAA